MTRSVRLLIACCALAAPCSAAYRLGLCPTPVPGLDADAPRRWALEAGCTMPRLTIRADLWRQPGGRRQPDQAVGADVAAKAEPLLELTPGNPILAPGESGVLARRPLPAGLFEPIFSDGSDTARLDSQVNPANTWARFVAEVAERYDGDGRDDAAGSPVAIWFTIAAPTGSLERAEALTNPELARLVRVAAAAAGAVSNDAKVGFRPTSGEQLDAVLRDTANRTTSAIDFVDFAVPIATASDAALFGHDGVASTAQRYQSILWDAGAYADLLCGSVGVPGSLAEGRLQRAAAAKSQLIGAVFDLQTVQWATVCDPSPGLVGLLGDARLLRGRETRPPARDGWYAYHTVGSLLGGALADGSARFEEELPVGNNARCYRFDLDGRELLVAWALDFHGDPDRSAEIRLPLRRDVRYGRYRWDYCLTGRADRTEVGGRDGLVTTVGIDPEYFLAGNELTMSPVRRDPPPPAVPWRVTSSAEDAASPGLLAVDGDPTTAWETDGLRGAWWTIAWPQAPVTVTAITVTLTPRDGKVTTQASEDGVVWRDVAVPFAADGFAPHEVKLKQRVSSRWWRLVFAPGEAPVRLHEVGFGDGPGRP